jgi:hypothetical protein
LQAAEQLEYIQKELGYAKANVCAESAVADFEIDREANISGYYTKLLCLSSGPTSGVWLVATGATVGLLAMQTKASDALSQCFMASYLVLVWVLFMFWL